MPYGTVFNTWTFRNSYDFTIKLQHASINHFSETCLYSSCEPFPASLKPRLTALPRFRACTVQKTASRGRCWLTFQRKLLAGCLQDSWKQTETLFFFGRSNQNEKTVLDLPKLFFRVFCHLISPKAWIQLGNLSHASLEPFADPHSKDARRAARVII